MENSTVGINHFPSSEYSIDIVYGAIQIVDGTDPTKGAVEVEQCIFLNRLLPVFAA